MCSGCRPLVEVEVVSVVIFGSELAYLDYSLHGFLHDLYGNELVWPVEVDTAGKDVVAGQSLEL